MAGFFSLLWLPLHDDCDGLTPSVILQVFCDVVGMLLVAKEMVLRLAERTGRDVFNTFIGLWLQADCGLFWVNVDKPWWERQSITLTGEDG